ncbi:S24 family peptidase [Pseudomonas chlororaphis]|uniref:Transcriptional regulator, Cro/CI family n=1 Tax=Pseudomonas chlororaphis O6 TaxID=1037915 RepID=A0AB33WSV3_9PSED|nr:helix-turn-helix transcriptional regulator [Pseudomonas chlororaphis]EIM16199.1 transcriptional regulator, Cro/CI family [Pseudomonas chlororaphis O6]
MTTTHSGYRLKEELHAQGIAPADFAKSMDVSAQTLNNWFVRGVPGRMLVPVANRLRIGVSWLNNENGPRHTFARGGGEPSAPHMSLWDEQTPLDDDEVEVQFLREVELAAGSGRFVIQEDEGESLRFRKRNLRDNRVQFDQAKCVTVRGNSMLPVLRDGATVGVDLGKTGLSDIIDGDLYAINHNGQLRVKQLYRLPSGIRLRSFNRDEHPDEDYSFQEMQEEQIAILGHVFWWGMYAR